jgi:hypothetical protein
MCKVSGIASSSRPGSHTGFQPSQGPLRALHTIRLISRAFNLDDPNSHDYSFSLHLRRYQICIRYEIAKHLETPTHAACTFYVFPFFAPLTVHFTAGRIQDPNRNPSFSTRQAGLEILKATRTIIIDKCD